ncbi:hypothetical protein [Bartonella sp. AU55XJBT]|nr:hypothetical protein [Bartonella sp. AU55XJBT]
MKKGFLLAYPCVTLQRESLNILVNILEKLELSKNADLVAE